MKEDSDQKERCNKKAEGKFGFLRTVSQIQRAKKPKNALYINEGVKFSVSMGKNLL